MAVELTFVPALLAILVTAGLGRLLSKTIKQPAILGELVLGTVLGSLVVLADPQPISYIADIGIIFLLFSTGLGLNLEEFKRLEIASSVVAVCGVALPFVLGYLAAVFFGFSRLIALFVGTSLVATSVGVKASILTEFRILRSKLGTLIMGAAVTDDVIGVILVSILAGLTVGGGALLGKISLLVISTILFFLISLTVVIKLFKKLSEKIAMGRENLLLLGIIAAVAFGLITEKIGLTAIIGAFVGGLVLGQTHFARRLGEYISLIGGSFFIPIFFVTMGMQFDVHAVASVGSFTVILVLVAILGKVIGCGLGARASKFSDMESLAVGVAMIPRAGVELVLLKLMLHFSETNPDVIPPATASSVASAVLVMVILTTLITPPLLWKVLGMLRQRREI